MKVKLINLDVKDRIDSIGSGWVPPLGLVSIATYIKEKIGVEPEIYDSTINDEKEIFKNVLIDCDNDTVLGFYVSILNYNKVLDLARRGKEKGATIVFGGPHVSSLEKIILQKRTFVDAIISGQGELPFASFLKKSCFDKIPNLSYRLKRNEVVNRKEIFDINNFNLDYSFLNLNKYWDKFTKISKEKFYRPVSYYTQKGCNWGKCIFCAIPNKKPIRKSPQKVWKEIKNIYNEYQVDYIYETADSFSDDHLWLEELAETKPSSIEVVWDIFSRADKINKNNVKKMKNIGVYQVCIGIETGDPLLLKVMNKGQTLENIISAVKLLKEYNIKLIPSFICGVAGETKSSLKKTLTVAKRVRDISRTNQVLVFPLTPLPNSKAYNMLISKSGMREKYFNEDYFDINDIQRDWRKYFCEVDEDEISNTINEIKNVYKI